MKLRDVRLLATEFDATVAFYRDVVGFPVRVNVDGVYVEFDAGAAVLGVYRRELMSGVVRGLESPGGERSVLCFEVDDVDERFRALTSAGAAVVTEPHDQSAWGLRVAHARDPDGNLLELFRPIAT